MMVILHRETIALTDLKWSYGKDKNCVYVIRYSELVLYVGKTVKGVRFRICQHMTPIIESEIGRILRLTAPEHKDVTVEILFVDYGLSMVEKSMILELRPMLNKTYNSYDVDGSRRKALTRLLNRHLTSDVGM